jgi:hypothetical protein
MIQYIHELIHDCAIHDIYIYIYTYIYIYIYIGLVMEEHYVDFGQQTQGPSTVCRAEFR